MMTYRLLMLCLALVLTTLTRCRRPSDPLPDPVTVTIENKTYPVVRTGNQVWTAINYDGPGGINYDNMGSHPEYGKYYLLKEAHAVRVPKGWRLPTRKDYEELCRSQGIDLSKTQGNTPAIQRLTSTTGWTHVAGTNTSGFNAMATGYIFNDQPPIKGELAEMWTSDGYSFSIQEAAPGSLLVRMFGNGGDGYRFTLRFIRQY